MYTVFANSMRLTITNIGYVAIVGKEAMNNKSEKTNPGWIPSEKDFEIPELFLPKHPLTPADIKAIHRHERHEIKKLRPVYTIESTVYYVMRGKVPA